MSALAIAACGGGPGTLISFLAPIARRIDAPILIVQQMPAAFTPVIAEQLSMAIGKRCREAIEGDVLSQGSVLLAPGDSRICVARCPAGRMVHIDRCNPDAGPVDALFGSAAAAFGARLLGVVLTGSGEDGRAGAARIIAAGGRVIVQDEMSSPVWDMPGAVAMAGYAEAVKPPRELGHLAVKMMNGDAA